MSAFTVTRRAGLAALGALALQGCASAVPTATAGGARIRAIKVDVSPIRASMGDPTAAWVEQTLPGAIAQALGASYAPGDRNGATLVARIDYVYLGPSSGGTGPAGATQDTMSGVLSIGGPRGGVDTPLRAISFYYPMAIDQTLWERAYYYRVLELSQAFAGWVPRKLGSAQG
jgi:hypothetical protein